MQTMEGGTHERIKQASHLFFRWEQPWHIECTLMRKNVGVVERQVFELEARARLADNR